MLAVLHWGQQVWLYYESCHQSLLIVVVFLRQTVDYFIFPSQKQAIEIWKTRIFYFKTFFHSSIMAFYSFIFPSFLFISYKNWSFWSFLRQTVDYFIFTSQKQAIEIWKKRLFYFKTFFNSSIMECYSLFSFQFLFHFI